MKFDVFVTLRGQVKEIEAPAKSNPMEAESLADLLKRIELPSSDLVEVVGIRIIEHQKSE